MDYQQDNPRLFVGFAAAILVFGGCAAQMKEPARICPGKESATESLYVLESRSRNTAPLKANGRCLLQYYAEDDRPKKENFPVKLWVNPPAEIYMQGDVAFDPRGVVLGSNEDEFWLAMKPKEISSYWWGRWPEESHPEKLMLSPRLVLEALGIVDVGDIESWSLSNEGAFDVLTEQQGSAGNRKIYINNCDYLVRRIEYFDDGGRATIIMELDKYKEVLDDFFVPTFIKIINCVDSSRKDSVRISLGSVKLTDFTDEQRRRLFARSQPRGFRHIYRIVYGNIIEQSR